MVRSTLNKSLTVFLSIAIIYYVNLRFIIFQFMKKYLFILLFATSYFADAQVFYRRSEFGAAVGGANYFGDLNPNYGFKNFRYSAGVFYKYNFTPYVTLGASMFYYDPYTSLDGQNYFLRPQGTEGQNLPEYKDRIYKNYAFAVPIGAGVKVWLSKGLTLSFEIVNRYTTTDYLDDVSTTYIGADKFSDQTPSPYPSPSSQLQDRSKELGGEAIGIKGRQRGVSTTKDHFMLFQLGLSFRMPTYKCPDNLR